MKISKNLNQLIGILLVFNIVLFSIIIFLFLETNKVQVENYESSSLSQTFTFLPKEVSGQINISSRAYIIYDVGTRTVLSGKNESLRFAPASTVKVITALIALEHYNLDTVLTVTGIDAVEGSKMDLVEGEQITVRNLLYGMMLPSGNDAAYILAKNYPDGVEAFVHKMNEKVKELNLANTKIFDPAGFDDRNYSTAFDLARLASYAIENNDFAKIVSTSYITVSDITGQIIHELYNLNELLGVRGVNGVKTGFTDEAQGVLITSILQDDRTYIVVVLNSQDRFFDTRNVIERGIENIKKLPY